MPTRALFPTLLYQERLRARGGNDLNARLLRECQQLERDDAAGRRWSKRNYPGGYTSYGSASRMHHLSPTFAALESALARHVGRFARLLALDLRERPLAMTDCWVNIMRHGVVHSSHLHPMSTISGTYYVKTPRGCPGLKFEDPRLDRMMAAPPRRLQSSAHPSWFVLPATTGTLVLFESWLRHEVPPSAVRGTRISISFNFSWF